MKDMNNNAFTYIALSVVLLVGWSYLMDLVVYLYYRY